MCVSVCACVRACVPVCLCLCVEREIERKADESKDWRQGQTEEALQLLDVVLERLLVCSNLLLQLLLLFAERLDGVLL